MGLSLQVPRRSGAVLLEATERSLYPHIQRTMGRRASAEFEGRSNVGDVVTVKVWVALCFK